MYQTTYLTFGGCLGIVLTPDSNTQTTSVEGVLQLLLKVKVWRNTHKEV